MPNTIIQLKFSTVSGNTPTSLTNGEIAINTFDGKIFYSDPVGEIKSIENFSGPSGLNKEIQFNDDGELGSNSQFTYDKSNSRLEVTSTRINSIADIVSSSIETTTTNPSILFTFDTDKYQTGKFIVQAKDQNKKQVTEILVLHDGVSAFATEYAIIRTGPNLFNLDVDVDLGKVRLIVTGTTSNTISYKTLGNLLLL